MNSRHRAPSYYQNKAYTVDSADEPVDEHDDLPGFVSYTGKEVFADWETDNQRYNHRNLERNTTNQIHENSQQDYRNADEIDWGKAKRRSAEFTYKSFQNNDDDYPFMSVGEIENGNLSHSLKEQDNNGTNKSTCGTPALDNLKSELLHDIIQEGNENQTRTWNKRSEKFLTMKNAKEIASQLGKIETNESTSKDIDSVYNRTVKRRCWSRDCWSRKFHSHATRIRLQKTPVSPATGFSALELNKQKARRRLNETWKNFTSSIFIWSQSMKTIEGRYGTGVVSYFIFLRWLLLLNIFICILVLSFIVLPQIVHFKESETPSSYEIDIAATEGSITNRSNECVELYRMSVRNSTTVVETIQDLLQGTGFLEITALFPGFYSEDVPSLRLLKRYNISLAYILVTLAYFLFCLIMMVMYTSEGVHEALKTSESQIQKYCNLVFGGWDYCIEEKKTAIRKHQSITQELKSTLFEKRRKDEVSNWSKKTKIFVFLSRCFVNIIVVAILGGAGYLIYFVCIKATELLNTPGQSDRLIFFLEFLPSLTITLLNIFLPMIFNIITKLERYSISFTIKITLVRTVFVKLASVAVLVWSFYQQLFSCDIKDFDTEMCVPCNKNENKNIKCWETYVGQQIYKLVILDFFVVLVTIFLIDYPRRLVYSKCSCALAKVVGPLEFDIPKHVLDLVYSQTLCWLGTFYSPLLPVICVLKCIIFFYLKKLTLLANCSPSQIPYRASRSNTFFMVVLMLSFVSSVIPVGYTIAKFSPSKGCGPFRNYKHNMWEPVSAAVESINEPHVKDILNFIASASFAVPLIVILCLLIYYHLTVSSAHKQMINVLKDQLILEGKDKQFLLARLTEDARQRLKIGGT